jgi:hypothetical protein
MEVSDEGGYTYDTSFMMPTVKAPPAEPATPLGELVSVQSKLVYGFDPGSPYGVVAYREGDRITIMEEGRFIAEGVIGRGDPTYVVDGEVVKMDADYHRRLGYKAFGVRTGRIYSSNEDHIVRGYD